MSLPCGIVGQQNVPWTKTPLSAIAALQFAHAADRDHELARGVL
jgi:hypothetical protein